MVEVPAGLAEISGRMIIRLMMCGIQIFLGVPLAVQNPRRTCEFSEQILFRLTQRAGSELINPFIWRYQ